MAKVLVIDDDELARFTMREILESDGHEVVEADNGEVGVATFKDNAFDLVITDILMPEKEGIETIMDIRQLSPEQKIVAVSGGGRDRFLGYLDSARELGADRVLAKPFSRSELLHVVDACVRSED